MKKLVFLALIFVLSVVTASAEYRYNPFTKKQDYYEAFPATGVKTDQENTFTEDQTVSANLTVTGNTVMGTTDIEYLTVGPYGLAIGDYTQYNFNLTTATSGTVINTNIWERSQPSAGTTAAVVGLLSTADYNSSNNMTGAGHIVGLVGAGKVLDAGGTATVAMAIGTEGKIEVEANQTVTTAIGVESQLTANAGTITSWYGYRVADTTATAPGTSYGYYLSDSTNDASTEYSFFSADGEATLFNQANIQTGASLLVEGIIKMTPHDVEFTTEGDFSIAGAIIHLKGDNDGDNDTIDLQDGVIAGQPIYLIAYSGIDADDTVTIGVGDTTCTNCPAIVFDKVGENAHLIWTGTFWVVVTLQDSL